MEIIIGLIILGLIIYFLFNSSSASISKESLQESLDRQKSESEYKAQFEKNKLAFEQFGTYILLLFKDKKYYTNEEFTEMFQRDFPLYRNGRYEEFTIDLVSNGLISEVTKSVRNNRKMPSKQNYEDFDRYDYYDDVPIGYELGKQFENIFLLFPNFITFCHQIYGKGVTSFNRAIIYKRDYGFSDDISIIKRINEKYSLIFGLGVGRCIKDYSQEDIGEHTFYIYARLKSIDGNSFNEVTVSLYQLKDDVEILKYNDSFNYIESVIRHKIDNSVTLQNLRWDYLIKCVNF